MTFVLGDNVFTGKEYLSSGIHKLSNSLQISDTARQNFLELKFFQIDKKL